MVTSTPTKPPPNNDILSGGYSARQKLHNQNNETKGS
jgi:hypothetical protein